MPSRSSSSLSAIPVIAPAFPSGDVGADSFASARASPSSNRVYHSLRHTIVTGRWSVGARLPSEVDLAQRFEVSRPVLRQALEKLRDDGLITSVRGSGSFVRSHTVLADQAAPTAEEMVEHVTHFLNGVEFRLILEPAAAALAALRRGPNELDAMRRALDAFERATEEGQVGQHQDFQFHEAIALATANPRIVSALRAVEYDVSQCVNLLRELARQPPLERSKHVLAEHRIVLKAIEEGDAEAARTGMRLHLEHARVRIMGRNAGV